MGGRGNCIVRFARTTANRRIEVDCNYGCVTRGLALARRTAGRGRPVKVRERTNMPRLSP